MELSALFAKQRTWDRRLVAINKIDVSRLQWIVQTELHISLSELASLWLKDSANGFIFARKRKEFIKKYVDCLQLAVSLGIEMGIQDDYIYSPVESTDVLYHFNQLFYHCSHITETYEFVTFMNLFLGTIALLQLSWKEIADECASRFKSPQGLHALGV
jgi:dimeric dUTPase (all-alpha-NTP-PPase superfamily)